MYHHICLEGRFYADLQGKVPGHSPRLTSPSAFPQLTMSQVWGLLTHTGFLLAILLVALCLSHCCTHKPRPRAQAQPRKEEGLFLAPHWLPLSPLPPAQTGRQGFADYETAHGCQFCLNKLLCPWEFSHVKHPVCWALGQWTRRWVWILKHPYKCKTSVCKAHICCTVPGFQDPSLKRPLFYILDAKKL